MTASPVSALVGPLALTLNADVKLDLPADWRWVPREQLRAYFSGSGREVGNWDLGVALSPGETPVEWRVQFQPLGAVDGGATWDPDALLLKAQARTEAANAHRRVLGQPEEHLSGWADPPSYDPATGRLQWGEHRRLGSEERQAWHARLLTRSGVLKLDWNDAEAVLSAQLPLAQALFNAFEPLDGQGLAQRQPGDRAADLDLEALVLEGSAGRGGQVSQGAGGALALAAAAAKWLLLAGLLVWAGLRAARAAQRRAAAAAAALRRAQREKDLGGGDAEAAAVEFVNEDPDPDDGASQ